MKTDFHDLFGRRRKGRAFAPARVNLIGDHIDYCGGLVLPMAIEGGTSVEFAEADHDFVRVFSERESEFVEVTPGVTSGGTGHWQDYVAGVAALSPGTQKGLDLLVRQEIGSAGLSSSASFCVALFLALVHSSGKAIEPVELAQLAQRVEHDYAGVSCGIMDQMSIVSGGAVCLDCATLTVKSLSWDSKEVAILIMDTNRERTLAGSAYNRRVEELGKIAAAAGLEDITGLAGFEPTKDFQVKLDDLLSRRLRHVRSEHDRVQQAVRYLEAADWSGFGQLLNESHRSLRDDYEVSCDELDLMVSLAQQQPGVLGARMTGGGFGGCAVALIEASKQQQIIAAVQQNYDEITGLASRLFVAAPAAGAHVESDHG